MTDKTVGDDEDKVRVYTVGVDFGRGDDREHVDSFVFRGQRLFRTLPYALEWVKKQKELPEKFAIKFFFVFGNLGMHIYVTSDLILKEDTLVSRNAIAKNLLDAIGKIIMGEVELPRPPDENRIMTPQEAASQGGSRIPQAQHGRGLKNFTLRGGGRKQ